MTLCCHIKELPNLVRVIAVTIAKMEEICLHCCTLYFSCEGSDSTDSFLFAYSGPYLSYFYDSKQLLYMYKMVTLSWFLFTHIFQTYVYARPIAFTKPVIFATAFMSFFSVVIALFKVSIILV